MITVDEKTKSNGNIIGIAAMAAGNALLIANDTLVKLAAAQLPMSEVIGLRATAAALFLLAMARILDGPFRRPRAVLGVRAVLEAGTSLSYLYALQLLPIGELAGLQQVVPLIILVGGAVVFHERIGWQGWIAALIGLGGAMLIVKPGMAGAVGGLSGAGVLLAVLAVVFSVARDLMTRAMAVGWHPAFIAGTSQLAMIVGGLVVAPFDAWTVPSLISMAQITVSAFFLAIANYWLVIAFRSGRLSVVAPFRYTGLLAALISGYLVWGQFPDRLSFVGCVIITLSGLFSLWQSRRWTSAPRAVPAPVPERS